MPDEKPVRGIIVYTDPAYKKAALRVNERAADITCRFREIVLTRYPEARLMKTDPRLVVLTPFTVPKNTAPAVLARKATQWHNTVCSVYPAAEQGDALAVLGLFIFDRFRQFDRTEVMKMLNLDWNNNPMVLALREEGMQLGLQQGLQEGLQKGIRRGQRRGRKKGREEGLQKGRQEGLQEGILKVLYDRFADVPDSTVKRIKALKSADLLASLLTTALHCNDPDAFESVLHHTDKPDSL
jgi:hypothetical protein